MEFGRWISKRIRTILDVSGVWRNYSQLCVFSFRFLLFSQKWWPYIICVFLCFCVWVACEFMWVFSCVCFWVCFLIYVVLSLFFSIHIHYLGDTFCLSRELCAMFVCMSVTMSGTGWVCVWTHFRVICMGIFMRICVFMCICHISRICLCKETVVMWVVFWVGSSVAVVVFGWLFLWLWWFVVVPHARPIILI